MAIPEELLDELLSAYLDGALIGDERGRVEQMLQSDRAVQDRLDQMRDAREAFVDAKWSAPGLPSDFPDQVVNAAIERTITDDLPANHPLRKATTTKTTDAPTKDAWRSVGFLIAIAASVLIAGAVAWPLLNSADQNDQVAKGTAEFPDDVLGSSDPTAGENIAERSTDQGDSNEGVLLADDGAADRSGFDAAVGKPDSLLADSLPADSLPADSLPATGSVGGMSDASDQIAASDTPVEKIESPPLEPNSIERKLLPAMKALLVLEVTRTEVGESTGAFDKAVTASGIASTDERKIDAGLARAVGNQMQPSESLAASISQVVLLEAPIKKLDRLVERMTLDRESFKSVRFSMISEAPLLNSIQSIRYRDPTQIKHDGKMIPIGVQQDDAFAAWAFRLGDRPFAPAEGAGTKAVLSAGMSSDTGPNPMGNLLLLVR